jgi:hypothetical protein
MGSDRDSSWLVEVQFLNFLLQSINGPGNNAEADEISLGGILSFLCPQSGSIYVYEVLVLVLVLVLDPGG